MDGRNPNPNPTLTLTPTKAATETLHTLVAAAIRGTLGEGSVVRV